MGKKNSEDDIINADESTYLKIGIVPPTPHDRGHLVYLAFVMLGAATLLPYNAFISAPSYFSQYYKFLWHTEIDDTTLGYYTAMGNWFLVWYSVTSIVSTVVLQFTVSYISIGTRVVGSCVWSLLVLAVPPMISYIRPSWSPMAGVIMLWICSAMVGITCAVFQSAVYGLASLLGGDYPQAVMTGIGLVGSFISALRLATLSALPDTVCSTVTAIAKCNDINYCSWVSDPKGYSTHGGSCIEIGYKQLSQARLSAAIYFFIGVAGLIVTLVLYFLLPFLPFYRHCIEKYDKNKAAAQGLGDVVDIGDLDGEKRGMGGEKVNAMKVFWKIKSSAFTIFFVFFVTLWIFPNLFIWVSNKRTKFLDSQHPQINPDVFTVLLILLFNVFDTVGRFIPKFLKILKPWMLPYVAVARLIFLFLFTICTGTGAGDPWLTSQWFSIIFCILFAISNGYVSTLGFMFAPSNEALKDGELEVVGVIIALSLFVGVAAGSGASIAYVKILDLKSAPAAAVPYPPAVAMPAAPYQFPW